MYYVIKTVVADLNSDLLAFPSQKTMYDGKDIAVGDTIYVIDSENEGGKGLMARGVVESVEAVERPPDTERWTPRVSITVCVTHRIRGSYGRDDVKRFTRWDDGQPETELNFKLYRQATNKIVGVTQTTADHLSSLCRDVN